MHRCVSFQYQTCQLICNGMKLQREGSALLKTIQFEKIECVNEFMKRFLCWRHTKCVYGK